MRTYPGRGHLYDLAVVGAGIAGSEAAWAAARAGLDVLLVTTSLDTVYMLAHSRARLEPPAGTLLAGLRGSPAADTEPVERWSLHRAAKYALEAQNGIHLLQSNVTELIEDGGRVAGVRTWEGVERPARTTALCVGSFLHARLEQGRLREAAGRLGEMAYDELFHDLERRGVALVPAEFELGEQNEDPPYQVTCRVLAGTELDPNGFALVRLPGLFAAGTCARGPQAYEESAADGLALGTFLAASGDRGGRSARPAPDGQ
jgi:tRNA U34 5-carboxymethylaminomethyl modifying enzyme MnmG/GidA